MYRIFQQGPIYTLTGGLVESYVRLMEQDETQITLFSARNITLAFIMLIGFIRIKDIEKSMLPFFMFLLVDTHFGLVLYGFL